MKYEITKEQILQLNGCIKKESVDYLLEKWFPEAFKPVLETGNWYKNIYGCLFCFNGNCDEEKDPLGYGFLSDKYENKWCDDNRGWGQEGLIKATESEVLEALKNEAVDRGYKEKLKYTECLCGFDKDSSQEYYTNPKYVFYYEESVNRLWIQNSSFLDICVFHNGVWAEIIPTIKKEEAEKLLNKKII